MAENSVKDLKDFFNTPEKPVSSSQMMEFWKTLTDEEKSYYRGAELS